MTSIAQSVDPLPGIRGLAFLGFPLHAPGRPDTGRADHLDEVSIPLLFIQGTRDRLSDIDLMRSIARQRLAGTATLVEIDGGDHSRRVPKRSGLSVDEVHADVARRIREWMSGIIHNTKAR